MTTRPRIDFHGKLVEGRRIRIGFIGCGSHSFRNLYPLLSFLPVELVATCDPDAAKASAFASQFGAKASYTDYKEMIQQENLEAVLVVTGYDVKGRPLYPPIVAECLKLGVHVWMEKPPADIVADVEVMMAAEKASGKFAMAKKMFVQGGMKAGELMSDPAFGKPDDVTAVWQPEFSLGQLYNNGLFLQGYWGELNEFCSAILEDRKPSRCGLEHAWQATRIFEAFIEGPGRMIPLGPAGPVDRSIAVT